MADRSGDLNAKAESQTTGTMPAYAVVADQISRSIRSGSLPEGIVLLEGPLASLFGLSRAPVKQALSKLEKQGLVSRFAGRGLMVGAGGDPKRLTLTPAMLNAGKDSDIQSKSYAWQSLYYDFEREIILRSVYGRVRLNEFALARHLDVGRTVAHDLLTRAREVGIVSKDERSRWWIVPLDEARFRDLYDLRILLEPAALASAIGRIPGPELDVIEARLQDAIERFPSVTGPEVDALEADLHIDCIGYSENTELVEALRRTRCILVAGKHIQVALKRATSIDPFMDEHLDIIAAVRRGDHGSASRALVAHLELSAQKASERLLLFRAMPSMSELPYIA